MGLWRLSGIQEPSFLHGLVAPQPLTLPSSLTTGNLRLAGRRRQLNFRKISHESRPIESSSRISKAANMTVIANLKGALRLTVHRPKENTVPKRSHHSQKPTTLVLKIKFADFYPISKLGRKEGKGDGAPGPPLAFRCTFTQGSQALDRCHPAM